jgi:hypothetical protein
VGIPWWPSNLMMILAPFAVVTNWRRTQWVFGGLLAATVVVNLVVWNVEFRDKPPGGEKMLVGFWLWNAALGTTALGLMARAWSLRRGHQVKFEPHPSLWRTAADLFVPARHEVLAGLPQRLGLVVGEGDAAAKLHCPCGHVQDLPPIPETGWVTIPGHRYADFVPAKVVRKQVGAGATPPADYPRAAGPQADPPRIDQCLGRLYCCPACGRLLWQREGSDRYEVFVPEANRASPAAAPDRAGIPASQKVRPPDR